MKVMLSLHPLSSQPPAAQQNFRPNPLQLGEWTQQPWRWATTKIDQKTLSVEMWERPLSRSYHFYLRPGFQVRGLVNLTNKIPPGVSLAGSCPHGLWSRPIQERRPTGDPGKEGPP